MSQEDSKPEEKKIPTKQDIKPVKEIDPIDEFIKSKEKVHSFINERLITSFRSRIQGKKPSEFETIWKSLLGE